MTLQQEIFEKSELDKEYDKILDNSDDEEADEATPLIPIKSKKKSIQDPIDEPIVKQDKRRGKRTKPISDEHRAILLDNLARGRAKALETRRKNAQLKKIERDEKISEKEEKLLTALNKKKDKSRNNEDLLKKIAELESKLKDKEIKEVPSKAPSKSPAIPRKVPEPVQQKPKEIVKEVIK